VVFPKSVVVRTAKSVILAVKVNTVRLDTFHGLTSPFPRYSLFLLPALPTAGYMP